jgi:hypothetical protein
MMSQFSHLTATLRTAPAAQRTAPIVIGAGWILAVASCSGTAGYVPSNGGNQAPDAATASPDAGSPDSDQSVGSGDVTEAGTGPQEDAAEDTTTVAQYDASRPAEDSGGNVTEGGIDSSPVPPACVPASNTDTLPFAVDDQYATSGYEGDAAYASAITMPHDTTCSGNRSSNGAVGACHTVLYTPLASGQLIGSTDMTTMGWAGVAWQYPGDNWGTQAGYAIPPGATSVAFSARGAAGGEVVQFWIGGTNSGGANANAPCTDPLSDQITVSLSTKWAQYKIPVTGPYMPAVLAAFGFSVSRGAQPVALLQSQQVSFYVDDIRWQM